MVDIVTNSHFRLMVQYRWHFCIITTSDISSIATFLQCDKMEVPNCHAYFWTHSMWIYFLAYQSNVLFNCWGPSFALPQIRVFW